MTILFIKTFILPALGVVFLYFIAFKNDLVENPLVCFLLATNFCTPTAINMITISIINNFQVSNLSKILIYQYLIAIITLTCWTGFYLYLFMSK